MSWKEHALAVVAGLTLFLCVFVTLPEIGTEKVKSFRHGARSYLRSVGADQYWPMFVGEDWDIPELRIVAEDLSGKSRDVTGLMLKHGWIYQQVLDDRMRLAHLQIARNGKPEIMDSYAASLGDLVAPEFHKLHFEAVYRTAKPRKSAMGELDSNVVLLGVYRREAGGRFEKE